MLLSMIPDLAVRFGNNFSISISANADGYNNLFSNSNIRPKLSHVSRDRPICLKIYHPDRGADGVFPFPAKTPGSKEKEFPVAGRRDLRF